MAAVQLCPLFPRTALGHHLIQSWVNQINNAPLNSLSEALILATINPKYEDRFTVTESADFGFIPLL
jgi:hypothetical protein